MLLLKLKKLRALRVKKPMKRKKRQNPLLRSTNIKRVKLLKNI